MLLFFDYIDCDFWVVGFCELCFVFEFGWDGVVVGFVCVVEFV